jgi:hypothetical protein
LKKWKYPPDGQDAATETVLDQAKELSQAGLLFDSVDELRGCKTAMKGEVFQFFVGTPF